MKAMGDSYRQSDHQDGVPWHEAPIPRRLHRCKAQSDEWFGFTLYQKCACGAVSVNGRRWLDKNSRREAGGWERF